MIAVKPIDANCVNAAINEVYDFILENTEYKEDVEATLVPIFNEIKRKINKLPTIRADEWHTRANGYWTLNNLKCKCSICEEETRDFMPQFCSACGAIMERRKEDVLERLH